MLDDIDIAAGARGDVGRSPTLAAETVFAHEVVRAAVSHREVLLSRQHKDFVFVVVDGNRRDASIGPGVGGAVVVEEVEGLGLADRLGVGLGAVVLD